jgi:hypothetical protein
MTTANPQSQKVRKHYDVVFPIVNTIILINRHETDTKISTK